MKSKILNYLTISAAFLAGCTDLSVTEQDSIIVSTTGEFTGVDAAGTLTSAYNNMAESSQQNLYALQEGTTDEILIPTRGTDWGDNGVWRDLAKHTWTPAHAYNNATWNFLNGNVYRTNQILHPATTSSVLQKAEAKFVRAYNMFWILDMWRQVPFRNADEGPEVDPEVLGPQAAFDFIINDLEEAIVDLPDGKGSIASRQFATQSAAKFLLAKLYLNKHIYLGTALAPADMTQVITLVDEIAADGYSLHEGYFDIFSPSDDNETILWSAHQYASRIWGGLHYNQGRDTDWGSGGWNGFATTADFYAKFDGPAATNTPDNGQEERRGYVPNNALGIGFLIGQQYGPDGALKQRNGTPLIFKPDFPALTGNGEDTGIRVLKYHPTINMGGTWNNHLLIMRYADAHLMKIEAILRGGTSADDEEVLFDELRNLRGASDLTATLDEVLNERGRELYIEGWRRNDLVRFGKFTETFGFVANTESHTNVFPIPNNALGSNPNLVQNPGY